jgi:hypothetical protein
MDLPAYPENEMHETLVALHSRTIVAAPAGAATATNDPRAAVAARARAARRAEARQT